MMECAWAKKENGKYDFCEFRAGKITSSSHTMLKRPNLYI
jgi:hypothetical protein